MFLKAVSRQDGNKGRGERTLPNETLERVNVRLLPLEIGHEDVLVELYGNLDELLAPLGRLGLEGIVYQGNVVALVEGDAVEARPQILSAPNDGLVGDEVNNAEKVGLLTDGELKGPRASNRAAQ